MFNTLEQENYSRILSEMSKGKVYTHAEINSLKRDQILVVHCINGESRLLHGVEYIFFNVQYLTDVDYRDITKEPNHRLISETQMIVMLHTDSESNVSTYPIFTNGSFFSNGAWIKDSVLIISEAYANFKQNLALREMHRAVDKLDIDSNVTIEIPSKVSEAFAQATQEDTTHDLRYIDQHLKLFQNFIGL